MRSCTLFVLTILAAAVLALSASCHVAGGDGASSGGHGSAEQAARTERFELAITDDRLETGPVLVGSEGSTTEFGRINGAGLEVPEGLPEDLPILAGAHVTVVHRRETSVMVGYVVPLPWEAASDALKHELRARNWWIESGRSEAEACAFMAKRADGRRAGFSVGDREGGQSALVLMTLASADAGQ